MTLAMFYRACPVGMTDTWRALLIPAALVALPMGLVLLQPISEPRWPSVSRSDGEAARRGLAACAGFLVGGASARGDRAARFFLRTQGRSAAPGADQCSIPKPIRWAPDTTSTSRRSRSDRAGFSARASMKAPQSHLNYLPEPHTDFVFATIGRKNGVSSVGFVRAGGLCDQPALGVEGGAKIR